MKKIFLAAIITVLTFPAMADEMKMKDGMMMDHDAMPAQTDTNTETKEAHEDGAHADWLKPVEAKYVCMVNNARFEDVQIPTEVNGKTYYGCCEMCKAKLEGSQELREATDPVSGNIVDKATAVIGADVSDDAVYYFENEENFQSFLNSRKKDSDHEEDHDNHH